MGVFLGHSLLNILGRRQWTDCGALGEVSGGRRGLHVEVVCIEVVGRLAV